MNREDIIRMAREAGFICLMPDEAAIPELAGIFSDDANALPQFERFAQLIVYDFLSELTNDDSLGEARIATIKRLAEKWGVSR